VTTPGQSAFRRSLSNITSGRCVCGRIRNKQGTWCCRMCRENYGTHSKLCRERNGVMINIAVDHKTRRATWRGLVKVQYSNGWLQEAGRCMIRMSPGRTYATFHDQAPVGASHCRICKRVVLRGEGRWWA